MKAITYLGIASNSFGSLNTSSFCIETEVGKWLLVDCGPDTPRQLKKTGVAFSQLHTVVLTHSHLDHSGGLPYLLFGRNLDILAAKATGTTLLPDETTLTLICEPTLGSILIDLLHTCHPEVKLQYEIRILDIRSFCSTPFTFATHSLRFVLVDHAVSTYGLRIDDSAGHSLAYSSDTLPCEAFVNMATGADLVIHEAMFPSDSNVGEKTKHSTTAQAGLVIKKIKPRLQALLMHIHPAQFANRQRMEAQASEIAEMPVTYPVEGNKHFFTNLS
jgi:ribonuclease Z